MRSNAERSKNCGVEYAPGEYCRNRKARDSDFCYVHRNPPTRVPAPEAEIQAEFLRRAEGNCRLPHYRIACHLLKAGAKILTIGGNGYPDILFEIKDRVFAIEVKGRSDRLGSRQRVVLDALRRLERVDVIRESGEKRSGELSLEELLSSIEGS